MLYFQPVGPAEEEFEADPRLFLRTMLYSAGGEGMANPNQLVADAPREGTRFMDILTPAPEKLPPWLSEHDVDVYAEAFEKSGFFGPVSFYRNMDANWERAKDIPASVYTMPTGFITGSLDPVNFMMPGAAEAMAEALPDFRGARQWSRAPATGCNRRSRRRPTPPCWTSSPRRDERPRPPAVAAGRGALAHRGLARG